MELPGWEPVCLLRTSQITHWANEATLMKKKKKDKGAGLGLEGPRPQRREDMRLTPEDRQRGTRQANNSKDSLCQGPEAASRWRWGQRSEGTYGGMILQAL